MGLYEDRLHDFIVKPGNFDYAWEMYEAVPTVRARLRREFMDEFEKFAGTQAKGGKWQCWRIEGEKVGISKQLWSRVFAIDLYVGSQYCQSVGVWHDRTDERLAERQEDLQRELKDHAAPYAKELGTSRSGSSDLWYLVLGTNFEKLSEMRGLLPDNREALMHEYWERMIRLSEIFEPVIDRFMEGLTGQSVTPDVGTPPG